MTLYINEVYKFTKYDNTYVLTFVLFGVRLGKITVLER